MGNRAVDEQVPEEHEDENRHELHALGEGPGYDGAPATRTQVQQASWPRLQACCRAHHEARAGHARAGGLGEEVEGSWAGGEDKAAGGRT